MELLYQLSYIGISGTNMIAETAKKEKASLDLPFMAMQEGHRAIGDKRNCRIKAVRESP